MLHPESDFYCYYFNLGIQLMSYHEFKIYEDWNFINKWPFKLKNKLWTSFVVINSIKSLILIYKSFVIKFIRIWEYLQKTMNNW